MAEETKTIDASVVEGADRNGDGHISQDVVPETDPYFTVPALDLFMDYRFSYS